MSAALNTEIVEPTDNTEENTNGDTNEKTERKDGNISIEARQEAENFPAETVQESERKPILESNEQANESELKSVNTTPTAEIVAPILEPTEGAINETNEENATQEPQNEGTKDTERETSTMDALMSREGVVEPNKETEEKEEQDAEGVKEENEPPEGQLEVESSIGELKQLIEDENDDEKSFQSVQGEIEEKQEQVPEETTIKEAEIVPQKKKKKRSKKSYNHDSPTTLDIILEPNIVSGDFTPLTRKSTLDLVSYSNAMSSTTEEEESDDEDEIAEISYEDIFLEYTRKQYYEMYNNLHKQYQDEKLKNAYLVKKLVNYYTQRKVLHAVVDNRPQLDTLRKYEKQLDDFERLTNVSMMEQMKLVEQLRGLETKFAQKESEAQTCFEKLQRHENELGKQIAGSESIGGSEEKVIERYLKRQKTQLNILKKIRLDYIKIRNNVTETQAALDTLDNFGSNLRLIDYEQLKFDNRALLDKLEEKELEITKVRLKCQNAVQILAHRREKASALEEDIYAMGDTLHNLTGEHEDVREQLNGLKQDRDSYRSAVDKITKKAGLLSKPRLLRNMCETAEDRVSLKHQLESIRKECNTITNKVRKLRKNRGSERKLKVIQTKMKLDETTSNSRDALTLSSFDNDLLVEEKSN